jgi:predicted  nucleic acid-binding Zn ribbon protein
MYTFNIIIKNASTYEDIVHHIYTYLHMLGDTGQILQREHLLVQKNNTIEIAVACPEMDSLDKKNCNQYGLEYQNKIEKGTGEKIEFVATGTEPDYPSPRYDVPTKKSSFYILTYGWSSPLLCGDTDKPIPLYKIPFTDKLNTDYSNIWSWQRHAQSLYRLWLSSQAVTEEFAANQMQDAHSEHSKIGRELCKIIEQKTGVPTYYFLPNYRRWTLQEDLDRKCPVTGNDWKVDGRTRENNWSFKCDESRLLSELSYDCVNL